MSKTDALKERIANYRELLKAILWTVIAMMSGVATIGYKILSGSLPAYMIVYGGIGLIVVFLVGLYGIRVWMKMEVLAKELSDE